MNMKMGLEHGMQPIWLHNFDEARAYDTGDVPGYICKSYTGFG